MVLLVVLSILFSMKVKGLECSAYDEKTCNYKGAPLSCYYDVAGSTCSYASCSHFSASESVCGANNGVLQCAFKNSVCVAKSCSDFSSETDCAAAVLGDGEKCNYNTTSMTCEEASCEFFAESEEICLGAGNGYLKCKYNASGSTPYQKCSDRRCEDYSSLTQADCESASLYNTMFGAYGCIYTPATDDVAAKCANSISCSNWSKDASTCAANTGKLDCIWDDNKCKTQDCIYYSESESKCKDNNGKMSCTFYKNILGNFCFGPTCSDFKASKEMCESSHPECHQDGDKCVAGSSAMVLGVPSIVSIFLLAVFACF